MNNLKKEFVLYGEALELKELGFDEPCFGWFNTNNNDSLALCDLFGFLNELTIRDFHKNSIDDKVSAPTFSQAFRWFRENFGLFSSEVYDRGLDNGKLPIIHSYSFRILNLNNFKDFYGDTFKTYEEAELACLKKLIEIVKQEQ
jgi:hypothetical protein